MKVKGKFNSADIFTTVVDDKAVAQIKEICDTDAFKDNKIRVMPDVHAGKGCTIGTTMTITDKIVPNMVGVDIGCGMEVVQLKERDIDLKKLDDFIKSNVPAGFNIRTTPHSNNQLIDLSQLRCRDLVDLDKAKLSLGSLGGGNHFIELDRDDDGNIYIVIHSGSRHLGLEVATLYQNKGAEQRKEEYLDKISSTIQNLKNEGRSSEIANTIQKLKSAEPKIPSYMAWVNGSLFDDYIADMKVVQQFAVLNRKAMIDTIVKGLGLTVVDGFTCIHNYIDTDSMIMRKGAVSAKKGEQILIPINMRDGALICLGKGNPDWNMSAPHGAGRILSRMQAKEKLNMEEFTREMQGIYTTTATIETIDESPMAYKSINDILDNIAPTADVVKRIKPIYNFKAGEQ